MKRGTVLGCGGALVAALGIAAVLLVVHVIRPTLSITGDLDQLATLHEKNAGVLNRDPFSPPPDFELQQDQVDRFRRVQTRMKHDLGPTYVDLETKARTFKGMMDEADPEGPGLGKAVETFRGLGSLLLAAKDAQVDALNHEAFSWSEYRWVRTSVYRSLDISGANVYFEDVAAELGSDTLEASIPLDEAPVSRYNRELVTALGDSVDVWLPFLVFGL